eukprot:749889-Hanusia_phi.AAC.4
MTIFVARKCNRCENLSFNFPLLYSFNWVWYLRNDGVCCKCSFQKLTTSYLVYWMRSEGLTKEGRRAGAGAGAGAGLLLHRVSYALRILYCAGGDKAESPTAVFAVLYAWVTVTSKTRPTQWGLSH